MHVPPFTQRTQGAVTLSDTDLDIIAALQLAPRASFTALAEILDTTSATLGKRVQNLQEQRVMSVIGRVSWPIVSSYNPFELWIRTRPGESLAVAQSLLQFPEAQFVMQATGSADVFATIVPLHGTDYYELLSRTIPQLDGIVAVESNLILHSEFVGTSWRLCRLTAEQELALTALTEHDEEAPITSVTDLSSVEFEALKMLRVNGRVSSAEVARKLGISSSTAFRTVGRLLGSGAVTPRVEVAPTTVGYPLMGAVAISADPRHVTTILRELSVHPSTRMLSTVSGSSTISFFGQYQGPREFADFLQRDLASFEGITQVRTTINLHELRRHWVDRDNGLLGSQVEQIVRRDA